MRESQNHSQHHERVLKRLEKRMYFKKSVLFKDAIREKNLYHETHFLTCDSIDKHNRLLYSLSLNRLFHKHNNKYSLYNAIS